MNKYKQAIENVKDSVQVGGTLSDATKTLMDLEELYRSYKDAKNELCLVCGKYKTSHEGSCNGCRWK